VGLVSSAGTLEETTGVSTGLAEETTGAAEEATGAAPYPEPYSPPAGAEGTTGTAVEEAAGVEAVSPAGVVLGEAVGTVGTSETKEKAGRLLVSLGLDGTPVPTGTEGLAEVLKPVGPAG
jgi:hypothetical protein